MPRHFLLKLDKTCHYPLQYLTTERYDPSTPFYAITGYVHIFPQKTTTLDIISIRDCFRFAKPNDTSPLHAWRQQGAVRRLFGRLQAPRINDPKQQPWVLAEQHSYDVVF